MGAFSAAIAWPTRGSRFISAWHGIEPRESGKGFAHKHGEAWKFLEIYINPWPGRWGFVLTISWYGKAREEDIPETWLDVKKNKHKR